MDGNDEIHSYKQDINRNLQLVKPSPTKVITSNPFTPRVSLIETNVEAASLSPTWSVEAMRHARYAESHSGRSPSFDAILTYFSVARNIFTIFRLIGDKKRVIRSVGSCMSFSGA